MKGKKTQMGYCKNVKVFSSVQIIGTSQVSLNLWSCRPNKFPCNQVVFGVRSEDLVPLEQFKSEILICLDGWVGMVRNVQSNLSLRFSDGSKVRYRIILLKRLYIVYVKNAVQDKK